jgi:hypothetical protein
MNTRTHIPEHIQHRVLDRSRRRCALCVHFNNEWGQKEGQIAHLDRDASNFAEDNLAFLCLPHHDDYDTKRRQTKNLTIPEAKTARDRLYAFIEEGGDLATAEKEERHHQEELRWQSEARRYLAPELNRTIERVLYIHGRAIANFVCASAEHSIKPNDRREDFIPHWPALYPNAPQCRDLAADDAAALIAFYDSLHALADFVNDWWEREGQLPVNIFNYILHCADKSLRLGLICVAQLEVEKVCPPPYEAWGTISSRIQRSLTAEAGARKQHIARYEAKAQAVNKAPSPPQGRNRR